jgi:hypothetical protein
VIRETRETELAKRAALKKQVSSGVSWEDASSSTHRASLTGSPHRWRAQEAEKLEHDIECHLPVRSVRLQTHDQGGSATVSPTPRAIVLNLEVLQQALRVHQSVAVAPVTAGATRW